MKNNCVNMHVDGEFCDLCFKPEKPLRRIKNKAAVKLTLYLSRVAGNVYVAVDGNFLDLDDFGIDADKFQKISSKIGETIKEIIRKKP